ncbi:uncharacterized protein TM35_000151840 [Trypanosoma theileri]|uniref:Mucin-associated surface protein (MASP) n=1 Tax=Trypanosoma theileri TaxID=67003 RepID=A0A1X0NW99_9TRYP|nr:uncharacterized protein TM35_000151840 [Trypanosoma theileri]ORC88753.1 hypothetical protein TM35_000151840 [Trypanosoma theileri]
MMMGRVMCVLAVVLCCACGYTMAVAATTDGQPKAVMAIESGSDGDNFPILVDEDGTGELNPDDSLPPARPVKGPQVDTEVERSPREKEIATLVKSVEGLSEGVGYVKFVENQTALINQTVGEGSRQNGAAATDILPSDANSAVSASSSVAASSSSTETHSPGTPSTNTTPLNSSEVVDSNQANSQVLSETTTEGSDVKEPNIAQESPAESGALTTKGLHGNDNASSAATTVKNKANVDSSVSLVWMRTAAPLLIVVVLFSATVY